MFRNLETKFIKRYWIELRPRASLLSHNSTGKLEYLREWKPGFFSFAVFLIMWNPLDIICNHFVFSGSYPLISLEGCQLTSIQVFKKTRLIFLRVFDIFLVVKFGCKEMSDLPKGKNNYEVKIWIKKHDLPKARVSDKTINFNFLKVSKITKINCLELSKVINSNYSFSWLLLFQKKRERHRHRHRHRQRQRQRQRETERETERDRERRESKGRSARELFLTSKFAYS